MVPFTFPFLATLSARIVSTSCCMAPPGTDQDSHLAALTDHSNKFRKASELSSSVILGMLMVGLPGFTRYHHRAPLPYTLHNVVP